MLVSIKSSERSQSQGWSGLWVDTLVTLLAFSLESHVAVPGITSLITMSNNGRKRPKKNDGSIILFFKTVENVPGKPLVKESNAGHM